LYCVATRGSNPLRSILMHTIIAAIILGLVEGVTEFVPVSSTGHLILAGHALGFVGPRAAAFEIMIQLGAILAVVWLYRDLLLRVAREGIAVAESRRIIVALFIAFLPAAIVGLLTHHWITAHLFTLPVMFAATGLDLWENRHLLSGSDALIFAIGFVVAFASALVVVRWLVRFVSHRSFDVFAWYRIVFGLALVALLATGRSWLAK